MLIAADTFEKLDFPVLMEVYIEGNRENGAGLYPEEPPERQLELAERDFEAYLREKFYGEAGGTYWIWAEDGRYLSALRLEPFRDGLLLEALETRPDRRRMGCAKKLIAAVLGALPKGTRICSHVSKRNVPSLATHLSCGFAKILDHAVETDGEIREHQVTMAITI